MQGHPDDRGNGCGSRSNRPAARGFIRCRAHDGDKISCAVLKFRDEHGLALLEFFQHLHVGRRPEPLHDVSLLVPNRHRTRMMPDPGTVCRPLHAPHDVKQTVWACFRPSQLCRLMVVWRNDIEPAPCSRRA